MEEVKLKAKIDIAGIEEAMQKVRRAGTTGEGKA